MLRLPSLRLMSAGFITILALATPANALNILLSNDDGYNAPGIVALKDALVKDGHKVTIVAPSSNRSGSSTALTFGPFEVIKISSDVYSLDSTPANTVKFGVFILKGADRPDLIVSGINSGANIGPSTVVSGTVGNVIAGIEEIDAPIPGIAFSTNLVDPDVTSKPNQRHFCRVAAFAAKLVHRFTRTGEVKGLEPRQRAQRELSGARSGRGQRRQDRQSGPRTQFHQRL
jgi:5'-nucleotidase